MANTAGLAASGARGAAGGTALPITAPAAAAGSTGGAAGASLPITAGPTPAEDTGAAWLIQSGSATASFMEGGIAGSGPEGASIASGALG